MIAKNITINIPENTANHPAALLVQLACQYDSSLYVEAGDKKFNAKSIMGMMSLDIRQGGEVTVVARGGDETEAMQRIETYLTTGH